MSTKLYHEKILLLLRNLKKKYPNQGLGRHISLSLADYAEGWDISDKEFTFALEKYIAELELNTAPELDVNKIINDASSYESLRAGIDDSNPEEEDEDGY